MMTMNLLLFGSIFQQMEILAIASHLPAYGLLFGLLFSWRLYVALLSFLRIE